MKTKKPNLLFVFADQMRGTDMGCAGNRELITPNLDLLAAAGFRFKNAISCYPVCTPYRACLFSGRYPTTTDVLYNDVPLPMDGKGFGHVLKKNGYRTGYVGKWHLFGPECVREAYIPPGPHRHGFDDLWAVMNCRHQYFDNFYYLNDSADKMRINGYEPVGQTDIAIDFISMHKDEPFALFLSWQPPHDPFDQVPQNWKDCYDPEKLNWRPNVKDTIFTDKQHVWPWYRATPDKEMLRDYYAAITALDYNMGRLMDHLAALGLDQDTIVVFTADHGEMMFSHGAMQKGYPWEESIHVPFILRYPSHVKSNTETMVPYNTVDIMPTLLSLMEIEVPDFAEGKDLSHIMKGNPGENPEAAYIMTAFPWVLPEWRGVRTERYTYCKTLDGALYLYDNLIDPYQLNNLVGKPEALNIEKDLDGLTNRMAEEIGDTFEPWTVIEKRMDKIRNEWLNSYGALC